MSQRFVPEIQGDVPEIEGCIIGMPKNDGA
jgi:hypothetical protein